ncbi:biotin--[acetyl-CoA-carboxylase] ligase [Miltoncostaea marina]|uniref:biotin--[acetyl-CoA-carboxylase] ligase n=1 Tax=Miltoncostaea marina TaxID=2843215 RepID=UPI001C3E83BB|nr:biotin--[acetyl-CoA-carboxylase] ligase [Miltoncostaea marina]
MSADEAAARREAVLAALVGAGPAGVSGEALAERMGCSRAAVHRHVEALRAAGTAVEAGRGGYRLAAGADPVVPSLVEPRLVPPLAGPVRWAAETGSTNDDLTALARAGAAEGTVVGADSQRAGRGRRGRSWLAGPGDALLVSVLLRPPVAPVDAGLLPVVVAVAVAEALGPDARIVWPNDVLVGGRKVAGILCESSADQERVAWAVAGVGVNVRAAPALDDARWTPGALADAGPPPARADLLVALLAALGRRYREWIDAGPAPLLRACAARDALAGAVVTVSLPGEEVAGTCAGTDDLGRLRLLTAAGERLLGSGEVVRLHR